MIIFDLGLNLSFGPICFIITYILILWFIFISLFLIRKINLNKIYYIFINNFKIVWYSVIIFIFTVITIINHKKFDLSGLNIETIIAILLLFLIILPFFKKIVAFGNELIVDLEKKSENLNKFEELNKTLTKNLPDEINKERENMLKELEEARKEVSKVK